MPRRKTMNVRKRRNTTNRRKTVTQPKLNRRAPTPKVYPFKRQRDQLLALENPSTGATGWVTTLDDAVLKTFNWNLAELADFDEFTSLFAQYKLNAAVVKFFPSYSQVISAGTSVVSNNMIITVWPNTDGRPLDATFTKDDLNQIQRKSQWMFPLNKPTSIKMNLKQLTQLYNSAVNTDYAVTRPRYIGTTETGTPHYGMNVHIQKVDGSTFGSDSARLKIQETVYLTCKQVR